MGKAALAEKLGSKVMDKHHRGILPFKDLDGKHFLAFHLKLVLWCTQQQM